MKLHSPRRLAYAAVLSGAASAALALPGAASAALPGHCLGSNVTGQGSSLQKIAQQQVWDPDFNANPSGDPFACSGTGAPTVTYTSTGSGAGMNSWHADGTTAPNFGPTNAFVGTDEPPDATQKANIESQGASKTLLTIPVLQAAVAIIVHLPTGCTSANSGTFARLILDNVDLEAIFRGAASPDGSGTTYKWSDLTHENNGTGVTLHGANCNQNQVINVAVRKDESGTTAILKKYLGLINGGVVDGGNTWAQDAAGPVNNPHWPRSVIVPASNGGGALASLVATTPGTIGYVNLADARANTAFIPSGGGGANKPTHWALLQNNGTGQTSQTYKDPATNLDNNPTANSNCANETYTNGAGSAFPPAGPYALWNSVTTSTTETAYTLCGLTYDLAMHTYSSYAAHSATPPTDTEAQTVKDFLSYVTDQQCVGSPCHSAGGQVDILNHDYYPLSGRVASEARAAAQNQIGY